MKHIDIIDEISFDNILNLMPNFKDISNKLEIYFGNTFAKPAGIAILSSLLYGYRDKIVIRYEQQSDIRYLQRVNFFKNLDIVVPEDFNRHDSSSNLLECNKIVSDNDPHFIDGKLKTT